MKERKDFLFNNTTHFIYGYMASDIGYGKGPFRKRERKPAATTWATLSISTKVFYMHHPTDRIAHATAFVTPVVGHWLE